VVFFYSAHHRINHGNILPSLLPYTYSITDAKAVTTSGTFRTHSHQAFFYSIQRSAPEQLSYRISKKGGGAVILEIIGGIGATGILAYTFVSQNASLTDAGKIQRVANNCGLTINESKKKQTIHLLRKSRFHWGNEYVYRIPLGLSFNDVIKKKSHIEDGLNHKKGILDLTLDDVLRLRISKDLPEQIKKLLTIKQRKEVTMEYDGTLIIKVYNEPIPERVNYQLGKGWKVCVGLSREGMVYHDFDLIPHMVVAGMTRYGKSVFLKNVVTSLIDQPVTFTLIDLKGGLAFNRFASVSKVATVATDVPETLESLREIQKSMKVKQKELLATKHEDIKESNDTHRHFIIVDEGAEIASHGETNTERKKMKVECEQIVGEIARIGGGLGYRLIFATQYPTADTLPRQVKQNADARLCFRLPTETASRVVLDEAGAEGLPLIKGRAIYRTDRQYVVQTPYIDNGFIDSVIRPHVVIKPRKEVHLEAEPRTRRSDTLVITEA
jgi:hypothetical protein